MQNKGRFYALVLALVWTFMVTLAGCGLPQLGGGGQRNVTDGSGTQVAIPASPQRIISVGAATDDILLPLVGSKRVVAISGTANNVPGLSDAVEGRVQSNVESVLSFNPDLVIVPDYISSNTVQALRDAGLTVYVYPVPRTIEESEQLILTMGDLVGNTSKSKEIVDNMERRIQDVDAFTQGKKPEKRLAYLTSMGLAGGKGSVFDDMANYVHFKNAAAELGYTQFVSGTREDVIAYNPDVIIVPTAVYSSGNNASNNATVDAILSDPAFANVAAVKDKQVYEVDAKPLMTYSQFMVDAMVAIAHDLYGYQEK